MWQLIGVGIVVGAIVWLATSIADFIATDKSTEYNQRYWHLRERRNQWK